MVVFRPLCLFLCIDVFAFTAAAAQTSPPVPQLGTCSVFLPNGRNGFCSVELSSPAPDAPATLTLNLTATAGPIVVAGYKIAETQNYNGAYIGPLVELRPGDLFKVRFLNALAPAGVRLGHHHGAGQAAAQDSTNLHTHGLIVPANNGTATSKGDGDNVFAQIGRGQSLDYNIKIPTALPATILDLPAGIIPHPSGLYWYHAHLHGISAAQLSGGMSGLLSIGRADQNVVGPDDSATAALRASIDVAHLLLRDIQITSTTSPDKANGSPALWTPFADPALCSGSTVAAADRPGFCTGSDSQKIWLFTVNGERFPTVAVHSGKNQLLRIANTSASVSYVLSLFERDAPGVRLPFELLSVDGVVPTTKSGAGAGPIAPTAESLLLMPAGRAEIYIRNDQPSANARHLVLRTEGLHTGGDASSGDDWPEVNLAQVELEPSAGPAVASSVNLAKQLVQAESQPKKLNDPAVALAVLPPGCIRDIDVSKREHRRITFSQQASNWAIRTQIVHPPDLVGLFTPQQFQASDGTSVGPIPFERYLKDDVVDWDATSLGAPKHVCVSLRTGHGQLWEIFNPTAELHNFHIHQSKFRMATPDDLRRYGVDPQSVVTNSTIKLANAKGADDLYIWHDTIPVQANKREFIIINFEAEEQLGRFVFHCHILEHEDEGLMAPVEVIP